MNKQPKCPNCPWRHKYDKQPQSLLGRLWRWHINYCPGWKAYFYTLSEEKKQKLRENYHFDKY